MSSNKPRKFDKKTAVHFQLVNRSQQDPLINYEDAPKAVLVEQPTHAQQNSKQRKEEQHKYGIFYDDDYDYLQHLKEARPEVKTEYQIEHVYDRKKKKFVAFNDEALFKKDDADDSDEDADTDTDAAQARLNLPSSLFESKIKMKDEPDIDWDPDIVEALNGEIELKEGERPEDYELDDDFVVQAQGGDIDFVNFDDDDHDDDELLNKHDARLKDRLGRIGLKFDPNQSSSSNNNGNNYNNNKEQDEIKNENLEGSSIAASSNYDEEDEDKFTFRSLGAKSQFTEYSVSSSVMRRSKGLTTLDEQFEQFYLNDYADDMEIGGLGAEEQNCNKESSEYEKQLLQSLLQGQRQLYGDEEDRLVVNTDIPKEAILKLAELQESKNSDDEEKDEVELQVGTGKNDDQSRWDCESILSTYSNLYNHPRLIREDAPGKKKLNIDHKTGLPIMGSQLSSKALKQLEAAGPIMPDGRAMYDEDMQSVRSTATMISQLSLRNKDENKEEKQQRKKQLREYMRERRAEKKLNKTAFKHEHIRQQREVIANKTAGAMKL